MSQSLRSIKSSGPEEESTPLGSNSPQCLVKSQLQDGGRCVGEAGIMFLFSILLPLASRVGLLSHHQNPDLLTQN